MNKPHIQNAIDRYTKSIKEGMKISPISQAEANIIKEIREALKKLDQRELVAILDGYKYYSDKDIEESLMEWNTNHNIGKNEHNIESKEGDFYINKWIKIQEGSYEIIRIFHFDRYDEYSIEEGRYVFRLIINRTPDEATKLPIYANTVFTFYSMEERDEIFDKLELNIHTDPGSEYI